MSDHQTEQPSGKPQMSTKPSDSSDLAKDVGSEYLKGAAKEGGEQTVAYTQTEEGQQQLEDTKTQAQGMWAKYCGCLSAA